MIKHLRWLVVSAAALSQAARLRACGQEPVMQPARRVPGLSGLPPHPLSVQARQTRSRPVDFGALTGWKDGEQAAAWPALLRFLSGAFAGGKRGAGFARKRWSFARRATKNAAVSRGSIRPLAPPNPDGALRCLVTGYYEPVLRGSRHQGAPFMYPVRPPDDLLTIDLSATKPDLRGMRLRGRVEGRRVVPYYSRAEIARWHRTGRGERNPVGR